MPELIASSPLQEIRDPLITPFGVHLYIKRLDLNHPHISGNKLYKLKYNIEEMPAQGKDTMLTFGGAYSNHIAATAAAGKEKGFKTIGVIRGDEHEEGKRNRTLEFAAACGMQLHFVSREDYRRKAEAAFTEELRERLGDFYLVPEGGSNVLGVKGCAEIANEIDIPFDYICSSCGTGATLAGLVLSLKEKQQAIGFSSLKGGEFLEEEVRNFVNEIDTQKASKHNWHLNHDHHFGRYAKVTKELEAFINDFYSVNRIPLDHVYTGKMMFGLYDMIRTGFFVPGEVVVALHTGGMQGSRGIIRDNTL
jgi:1-aminocyclopropane-1-carboxylate deaminase